MRTATLTRTEEGNDGTFGHFVTDSGLCLRSGELPWRDNHQGISCIPVGVYFVVWAQSPLFGWCYHVENVPGRIDIEIHPGNFCGDRAFGLRCDLKGCISLGQYIGELEGQKALLLSRKAFSQLNADMKASDFEMTILEKF